MDRVSDKELGVGLWRGVGRLMMGRVGCGNWVYMYIGYNICMYKSWLHFEF